MIKLFCKKSLTILVKKLYYRCLTKSETVPCVYTLSKISLSNKSFYLPANVKTHFVVTFYCWDFFFFCCKTVSKLKVGLSPSKKNCVICFIESPLKIIKNVFYFILKALFVLKVFNFLSWCFGHVGKTAWLVKASKGK